MNDVTPESHQAAAVSSSSLSFGDIVYHHMPGTDQMRGLVISGTPRR